MHQNSILDVGGLHVGQVHDGVVKTGVTVIVPNDAALCSVDVRGGGPGTREIMALQDGGLIDRVHAIVLSGGSVYGLAAADGVTAWLGKKGVGFAAGPSPIPVSPIVPSAILFDNANGGDKNWGLIPPFRDLGVKACAALSHNIEEGAFGAGHGAMAGLYPGGVGTASEIVGELTIGALIAANPVGSPYMPGTDCPWAWAYEVEGEFGGRKPPSDYILSEARDTKLAFLQQAGQATVIGAVAINAPLSQKSLKRIAIMAQDGIAMAVQPAHTPLDGDTIFALSTAKGEKTYSPVEIAEFGAAAARCVSRALMRGVYFANK